MIRGRRRGPEPAVFTVDAIAPTRPYADRRRAPEGAERSSGEALLPVDKVSLSPEARQELRRGPEGQPAAGAARGQAAGPGPGTGARLDEEQQRQLEELQQRDAHVRQHEAAHQAAGGDLTGPASYSFEQGPDGRSYAVGGEVPVQARSGRTPDETIAIARRVRAAALAPSDPSPADLAAAAAATQVELQAMQQKQRLGARQALGAAARGPANPDRAAAQPITTPQANLERLIVRAPEAEQFM